VGRPCGDLAHPKHRLETASLNGGSATYSTAGLAVGSHAITAQYLGDANFSGNTSPVVSQTVGQAGTTTSVAASPSSSVYGQSVTFTATIGVVAPGAGTPTGSVTFMDGSTTLGTGTLNGTGTASFTTSDLAIGSHAVTAVYGGDGNFTTSSSNAASQVVNQASTTTTLAASPSSTTYGQSVTFTATIGVVSPGAGTPTGSVEFFDGTTPIGTIPLSGSTAAVSTAALTAGTHSITAQYLGDGNFSSSTSFPATLPVRMASTTTNLSSSASTSVFGQSVTFTATIGVVAPGAGVPTGSVTFKDGSTTLGSATLGGTGTASFTTSSLSVGSHSIEVSYGGDADSKASTSAILKQSVRASSSSSAAQLVDQALSALPEDDAPTVGSTVHDLALEQVSVRNRRPHRSHWRLS
jgi:Bacterial Ig-like domain (group 3)